MSGLGWFWRRRDHGYRHDRHLGSLCRRCGGHEFSGRHPRGYWVPGLKSRWDGRILR